MALKLSRTTGPFRYWNYQPAPCIGVKGTVEGTRSVLSGVGFGKCSQTQLVQIIIHISVAVLAVRLSFYTIFIICTIIVYSDVLIYVLLR